MVLRRLRDILTQGYDADFGSVSADDLRSEAQIPQDVTGARSPSTWYQNTTEYPLKVYVTATTSGAGNPVDLLAQVNDTQTQNEVMRDTNVAHDSSTVKAGIAVVVPPDDYYQFGVTGSLDSWYEQKLGIES